jgi:hypothetical protein
LMGRRIRPTYLQVCLEFKWNKSRQSYGDHANDMAAQMRQR